MHSSNLNRIVSECVEPGKMSSLVDSSGQPTGTPRPEQTEASNSKHNCVHELFAERVKKCPHATAVVFETEQLTYARLDGKSNQLARKLRDKGVGPEGVVAVCMDRSLEMEVALLAVLKAGAAYAPLDPAYPQKRLSLILKDTGAPVVLTQNRHKTKFSESAADTLCLDADWSDIARYSSESIENRASGENLAYIIFTSGSTGVPKGVMIEHRALLNRLRWMQEAFQIGPHDSVLQKTPCTFDVSVWEFFWPVMYGARLIFAKPEGHKDPDYLIDTIVKRRITCMHFVPSMLEVFLESPYAGRCNSLKKVICSGEALTYDLRRRFFDTLPGVQLHNLYGPTEAAIDVSWWDCSRDAGKPVVPIGKAIANTQLYILDKHLEPVQPGVSGQLHIGGIQLARGYLNRPDLTKEKFIPNPLDPTGKSRLYKTGDLCRYLPDGNIEYLGRLDHQVKIRGFRIELSEIEAVLTQHPQVRQAVVLATRNNGNARLVAYITCVGSHNPSYEKLRNHLANILPEYMVPSLFVFMDQMPLSPNGKIDRKALPAPETQVPGAREYTAPQDSTQQIIADAFAGVLGMDKVGIDGNFFELGGHSLAATRAVYRIRSKLNADLTLPDIFTHPTVASLSALIQTKGPGEKVAAIEKRSNPGKSCCASSAQKRMWFLHQLEPNSPVYNIPFLFTLKGKVDIPAFEQAVNDIIRRHDSLRTTFDTGQGEPVQIVHPYEFVYVPVEPLAADRKTDLAENPAIQQEARGPFDLRKGPLVRIRLFRLTGDLHILIVVVHHIVFDGWSADILQDELIRCYSARAQKKEPDLPELTVQYCDYAQWQNEWLRGELREKQMAYWLERLKGPLPVLDIPADKPRPAVYRYRGRRHSLSIEQSLCHGIYEFSKSQGKTTFMTLLSAFEVLLRRYTGQDDILVGSPIANRTRPELEDQIGLFVNTVVLRADTSDNPTFLELLSRTRQTCIDAYANQDLPFEQLVDRLQPERDVSRSPVFQVMFVLQDGRDRPVPVSGIEMQCRELSTGTSKCDLIMFVDECEQGFSLTAEYNTDIFADGTIRALLGHYRNTLEQVIEAPETRIADFDLLTADERTLLMEDWNATATEYPRHSCIHEIFTEQARKTPDAVAVVYQGEELTYRRLDEKSNQLACLLRQRQVDRDVPVGVCMDRSTDLIVALLGVLKAGGAYVPLDPSYPAQRLEWMASDTGLKIVLTQKSLASLVQLDHVEKLCLDTAAELIEQMPITSPAAVNSSEDLAYIIYTSGSTGRPKGVEVPHKAVIRLLFGVDYVDLASEQTFLQLAPVSFDASTFEIWGALLHGHRCVLYEQRVPDIDKLGATIAKYNVSCLWLTASLFNFIIDEKPEILEGVAQILTGGEALSVDHIKKAIELLPNTELINGYGPTESTTFTCCHRIGRKLDDNLASIPIGRPIGNTRVYILDENLEPVPRGVKGELHIGGDGLARGYVNSPELTNQKFIANPFDRDAGKLYKTGDLCRYLPDGTIEYLGRRDRQVKIRGFRIELGEIENAIARCPAVRQTTVLARQDIPGDKQLVAYIVAAGNDAPDPQNLKSRLSETLPDYMIPTAFVFLESMPLTVNGKIDRNALPEPEQTAGTDRGCIAPQTPTQTKLANIFARVLGLEKVGIRDNFFECGGHSLLAAKAVHLMQSQFEAEILLPWLFRYPTVEQLARIVDRPEQFVQQYPIPRVDRSGPICQSHAQQRLWFINELVPNSPLYNVPLRLDLHRKLDVEKLEEALNAVIERHESLRTTFDRSGGRPVQIVCDFVYSPLEVCNLSDRDSAAVAPEISSEAHKPFNIRTGPLIHYKLFRLSDQHHVLLTTVHHIVFDAWSADVFLKELAAFYDAGVRGLEPDLPQLPLQYVDYAHWQRHWLDKGVRDRQMRYWLDRLKPPIAPLDMPTDHPRPPVQTHRGDCRRLSLEGRTCDDLRLLARRKSKTGFMTAFAAFVVLLHRYTGQEDIVVGSPVDNRTRSEFASLIGFFVNTLALRVDLSDNPTFAELLDQVGMICQQAYENRDLPFEELVDRLGIKRDPSRSPLFHIVFAYRDLKDRNFDFDGLDADCGELYTKTSKFDLTLFVDEHREGLQLTAEYNTDLYSADTVDGFLLHYRNILKQVTADPETAVADINLISADERRLMLEEWNATTVDYPNKCIHELFAEQVQKTPNAVAVVCGDEELTYRRLHEESDQLACCLRKRRVTRDTPVGVCMDRCTDMIVALLAILKAGGTYVPLDPSYPPQRIEWMVADSGVRILLTQQALTSLVKSVGIELLSLDNKTEEAENVSDEPPASLNTPDDPAYIMYTSGSTGQPKGVEIPHKAVIRLLFGVDYVDLTGKQTFLQLAPVSFDASTFEIWGALLHGHRCVLFEQRIPDLDKLGRTIHKHNVSCLWLTASLFNFIIDEKPEILTGVSQLLTGGEPLSVAHIRKAIELLPDIQLINGYGPTESTTFTCCHRINRNLDDNLRSIPIGRPIGNTRVYILDKNLQPVPRGAKGQLHIAGDGLARGYLNRPELTRNRFIADPFDVSGRGRLYKTGDLCRYLPDGTIEYLGRLDRQVKIRGFRIELAEIENAITRQPGVRQAAVMARQDRPGDKQLVAYVVAEGRAAPDAEALNKALVQTLPQYMVPSAFVFLSAMPMTANGKTNYDALPKPGLESCSETCVSPRTPAEQALADIFAEVLSLEKIGIHDDFFELGGHSLLAVKLLYRIHEHFDRFLPLATLFKARTVAELTCLLEDAEAQAAAIRCVVEMKPGSKETPVFILPGVTGYSLPFSALAKHLDIEAAVYGLELQGLDGRTEPHRTIQDIARFALSNIRRIQPSGPYYLGGYSLGGRVAYEVAVRLAEQGERVNMLALIAATAPGHPRDSKYRPVRYYLRIVALLRLPFKKKLNYLRFKLMDIRRRIGWFIHKDHPRYVDASPDKQMDENIRKVRKYALDAWHTYKNAEAYDGDVLLIRDVNIDSPLIRSIIDAEAGWDKYVTGDIEVHEVDSGHLDILKEPHVRQLAAIMSDYIRRTDHAAQTQSYAKEASQQKASPHWNTMPSDLSLADGHVHLVLIAAPDCSNLVQRCESWLSVEERARAMRYNCEDDRTLFVLRRGMLRKLLADYAKIAPAEVILEYDKHGKPKLKASQDPENLNFSISSRKDMILYGFSTGCRVGVDLEYIAANGELLQLARENFSGPEYETIVKHPDTKGAFYRLWTCKEAYIKARGILPLDRFSILLKADGDPELVSDEIDCSQIGRWSFRLINVGPAQQAAVAVNTATPMLKHWTLRSLSPA